MHGLKPSNPCNLGCGMSAYAPDRAAPHTSEPEVQKREYEIVAKRDDDEASNCHLHRSVAFLYLNNSYSGLKPHRIACNPLPTHQCVPSPNPNQLLAECHFRQSFTTTRSPTNCITTTTTSCHRIHSYQHPPRSSSLESA